MGTGLNTNYESILQQAQSMLGQISSGSGSNSSFNTQQFFQLGNLLNGSTSYGSQSVSSENAGSAVVQSVINNVMSILKSIATTEAKAAATENKKAEKEVDKLNKEEEKQRVELMQQMADIDLQMSDVSEIVSSCTGSLEEINAQLQEKQQELADYVEQIRAEQDVLQNCKPEEREGHLNKILALSDDIKNLTTSVADLQAQITSLSSEVENSYTTMEELKGNSVEVQENGESKIQELANKGGELVQANANMQLKGVTNTATGQAAETAAKAASSNVLSAGTAPKLYRVANDQTQAGSTRTKGAVGNLREVCQGIGNLSNHVQILNEFNNSIGKITQDFTGLIGDWNTALEPAITSIGSWQTVQEQNTVLNESVNSDIEKVSNGKNTSEIKTQKTETQNSKESDKETSDLATLNFQVDSLNPFEKTKEIK